MAAHKKAFTNMPYDFSNVRHSPDFGDFRRPANPEIPFVPRMGSSRDGGMFFSRPMLPNPRHFGPAGGLDPRGIMHTRGRMLPPPALLPRPDLRPPPPSFMGPRARQPFEPSERFGLPWYRLPAPSRLGPNRFPFMCDPPGRYNKQRPKPKKGKQRDDSKPKIRRRSENGEGDSADALERKMQKKKKQKPWMTDDLFEEVRKKRLLYLKAKKDTSTENWQAFRAQRNRVSALVKEAKMKGGFLIPRKKLEENSEDDSKDKPFSCDTCDASFSEQSELDSHLSQHVMCMTDGCSFEAHMKVVEIHRKMQHDTGYAQVIMKLDTPEEIEKWKSERKKNFPTSANVAKRKLEQAEKEARGEVMETKEFGSRNDRDKEKGMMEIVGETPKEVEVEEEVGAGTEVDAIEEMVVMVDTE